MERLSLVEEFGERLRYEGWVFENEFMNPAKDNFNQHVKSTNYRLFFAMSDREVELLNEYIEVLRNV